jgi:rSAM/selenodomain-associated transferase 1
MTGHLILFTKYPESGRVKTRLISALGKKGAAELHKNLTEHCLTRLSRAPIPLTVFYTGGTDRRMADWLPDLPLVKQEGTDLGQRMITAFSHTRTLARGRILLAGSDCPDLSVKLIRQGLTILDNQDLDLGPTFDGGYYLIGISADFAPADLVPLMTDITWGTAEVLQTTLTRVQTAGFSYDLLPTLHDIDRPKDLEYFHHHARS